MTIQTHKYGVYEFTPSDFYMLRVYIIVCWAILF